MIPWKWKIPMILSVLSGLMNIGLFILCVWSFKQGLSADMDPLFLVILSLFTGLFALMVISNFFSWHCYLQYPHNGSMSQGTRMFYLVMRMVACIHAIAVFIMATMLAHSTFTTPGRIRPSEIYGTIAFILYTILSFYLVIRQFVFLEYLKFEEKKKLRKMIEEIGIPDL